MAADGVANAVIADEIGVTPVTVRAWRIRFGDEGLAGLEKIRRGRVGAANLRSARRLLPRSSV